MLFIDFIKALYYEIRSKFVPEKVKYRLEGSCNRCGECCRYMYSLDSYTREEFELMVKFFPKYKRLKIIGRDEFGNFVYACTMLTEEGLCSDYKNRLDMCKKYPCLKLNNGGELHKTCGFKIIPEKSFEDYLSRDFSNI